MKVKSSLRSLKSRNSFKGHDAVIDKNVKCFSTTSVGAWMKLRLASLSTPIRIALQFL